MNYKRYQFALSKPQSLESSEWEEYINRLKEMEAWLTQQNWRHWGAFVGGREGFWFYQEKDYTAFKQHFGVEE
jgi:hypothetical protein